MVVQFLQRLFSAGGWRLVTAAGVWCWLQLARTVYVTPKLLRYPNKE